MTLHKITLALLVLGCPAIFAGSLVCAGESVHYSNVTTDTGIVPPTGTHIGTEFLAIEGKLVGKRELIEGGVPTGKWDIQIDFTDEDKIADSGAGPSSWKIYTATIAVNPEKGKGKELARELVTCRQVTNLVP